MYEDIFHLKDKVILVTGGLGLIGRELVKGIHDFGGTVICIDIANVQDVNLGEEYNYLKMDITDEKSIKEGLKAVLDNFGRIDGLVNTAYPRTKNYGKLDMEDMPWDEWTENLKMHLGGYFLISREVAKIMKRLNIKGSIINFGSTYGVVGPDFSIYEGTEMKNPSEYAAIKGGIINLTRYLATYYAKYGIRFNTVSPGGVFDHQPSAFVEKYVKRTPLGRMANPGDIVGAVVFLLSDASRYVTGVNLMVDGGWTAW